MAGGDGSAVEASGLVNTLQGHVDEIRSRLQCGICIRPLYEPFSLACGHTFCYTCLTQWFSGGRSKRTCPDCRAPVKTQPAPAYLVREIVHMFTSRAELLDKGETTAEHLGNRQAESEKLDQDKANTNPHTGGLFGGLFKPKAPALKPLVDVDDGVVRCPRCQWELEEDACGGCGWVYRPDEDITDYSGSDEDDYDDETDFDSMLDREDDMFGDIDDDDSAWGPYGAYDRPFLFGEEAPNAAAFIGTLAHSFGPHVYQPHQWGRVPGPGDYESHYEDEDDFDEEEEDEYDESDSFIDDEERPAGTQYDSDHSTVVGANGPLSRASSTRRQGRPVVNLDSSSEDPSDSEEGDTTGVSFADGWNHRSSGGGASSSPPSQYHDTRSSPMRSSLVGDEASEDEDEDEDDSDSEDDGDNEVDEDDDDEDNEDPLVSGGRYRQRLEVPTSSNIPVSSDESEVTESPSPQLRRPPLHTGSSAHNAITIADSDEEQPVGPGRRAAQRRARQRRGTRFSPY